MYSEIPTREDFAMLMKMLAADCPATKRSVRFESEVTSTEAGPLPFEELKSLWYNPKELGMFKSQARGLARGHISCPHDDLRGLEHTAPQRQKHRYMTIRCTLSAARRGMSADQIGMVARKCTAWSEEIAFVQGCRDYAHVYQPGMVAVIPAVRSSPPEFPFAIKSKRSAYTTSDRRVRRRLTVQ